MSELHDAIRRGDLAAVERLLDGGASALALAGDRESALRAAHARLGAPEGPAIVQRVKRSAREAVERAADRRAGIGTRALERASSLRAERGAAALRAAAGGRLDVLLVEGEVKNAARALASLVASPRREADVASRPVADAARLLFCVSLRGLPWTLVPLVLEPASPWNVEHVRELAARGSGVAPLCRALAREARARTLHLEHDTLTLYTPEGAIDRQTYEPEEWWAEEQRIEPARAPEARRAERLRRLDARLAELGALVPPMRIETDGWGVQLVLSGVAIADVERADVVVLQELGEPAVDRALGDAPGAPAVVGPGGPPPIARAAPGPAPPMAAPSSAGLPAPAHAPPPRVSPAPPSGGDGPRPSAPPPIVGTTPPLGSDAPRASAPPPIVAAPPSPADAPRASAPPPIVAAPPSPADAPRASAPPPIVGTTPPLGSDAPRASAPPPIVAAPPSPADAGSAPPPIVAAPPSPADAPGASAPPPIVGTTPPLGSDAPRASAPPPIVAAPPSAADAPRASAPPPIAGEPARVEAPPAARASAPPPPVAAPRSSEPEAPPSAPGARPPPPVVRPPDTDPAEPE